MDAYEVLCEPLLAALEGMGVDARFADEERPAIHQPACYLRELHPAHDVVAGDGRKISGNAQYRQRDSVIQHGSLTFASQPERHLSVFAAEDLDPDAFRDRVTSVSEQSDCSRAGAVDALETALESWADAAEGEWTDEELACARERAETKYESAAWNRDRVEPA
jgi:lipoate-protein ligase A